MQDLLRRGCIPNSSPVNPKAIRPRSQPAPPKTRYHFPVSTSSYSILPNQPPLDHEAFSAHRSSNRLLKENLRGEVRFDLGSRALYAADSSNYRQLPIGVVFPRDAEDVEAALCRLLGHGRRRASSRRRNQPCRPVRQCRRGLRLLPLHERPHLHRPWRQAGHRTARHRPRPPPRRRRSSITSPTRPTPPPTPAAPSAA